jgi:hypothetical protein
MRLKTIGTIWAFAGQGGAFGKELVSRPERFYRICEPFNKKGFVINHFNTN